MNYRFIYSNPDASRIITGINLDARFTIAALESKTGFEVKAYSDTMISAVTESVLFYKIETTTGSLAGYFSLTINTQGLQTMKFQQQLRPAFQQFESDINQIIANFIATNEWTNDFL